MIDRCSNENHPAYPNYGGRGIRVCEEWHDPFVFFDYLETLGPCPTGWSMDRIDNDGNYEPGNIRWADRSTQNSNRNWYPRPSREEYRQTLQELGLSW